jgi:HD superfamily phosphodiesterase
MNNKAQSPITQIKKLVKKECENLRFVPDWFYENHLLAVEKWTKFLLKKLPKADGEIVLLGVWLHDLQRIRGIKGNHQKIGATEAEKIMKKFEYSKYKIDAVKSIILVHSCSNARKVPKTLEGKILASADAMAHYVNDFYLQIAVDGKRTLKDYKKWALEKLNRDYNRKIFFKFAKKEIEDRHKVLLEIFRMK